MKKSLRHSLIILSILFVSLIALAVILPIVLDPNIYRETITRQVEQRTGRSLTLGKIELSVFPWLGVQLNDVQLNNPAGFQPAQMLMLKKLQLHVLLLPLFKGEIHVGEVTLDTLEVNLARNKKGITNWDDLLQKLQQTKTTTSSDKNRTGPDTSSAGKVQKAASLPVFEIDGMHVVDAKLVWNDELQHRTYEINQLKLEMGELQTRKFFPLETSFNFTSGHPRASGQIQLTTTLDLNPISKTLRLRDIKLHEKIKSTLIPGGHLDLTTQAESVDLDSDKQILEVSNLEARTFNASISSSARITSLFDRPEYEASVKLAEFSPRKLARALKITLPPSADPKVLESLALSTKITGDTRTLQIKPLSLKLDDTQIKGHAAVQFKKQPLFSFSLSMDQLDVDRYLPPAKKEKPARQTKLAAKHPAQKITTKVESPAHALAGLTHLDLDGALSIQKLKVSKLQLEQIHIPVKSKQGLMKLIPVRANLYQGTSRSAITLLANAPQPRFTLEQQLSNIQLAPLLKDLTGKAKASGLTNISTSLSTKGLTEKSIKSNLNGKAKFSLKDGEIKGINIPEMERKINAALKRNAMPVNNNTTTAFSDAHGSALITNGVIINKDLRATLSHARAAGLGQVSLPANNIDYTLLVKFTSEATAQSGTTYDQMDKAALPIQIHGPLNAPSIKPDYEALLKELARRELKKQETRVKKRLEEEVNKKLSDELKKLFNKK